MKKKRAFTHFIVTAVLALIGVLASFLQFNVPGTFYKYNGFANALNYGIDLKEGYVAVYNIQDYDDTKDINLAVNTLTNYLKQQQHDEVVVLTQTSDSSKQIRVEVSKLSPDIYDVLKLLGEPKELEIKKEKSDDAEAVLTGEHIKSAVAQKQLGDSGYIYGVSIEFNEKGTKLFKDVTTELAEENGSLYLYLGGEFYNQATVSNAITDGKTFISGGMSTLGAAQEYATKIISGSLGFKLSLDKCEVITPSTQSEALTRFIIISAVVVVILFATLIALYKDLGLVSMLSATIFAVIYLFLMQSISILQISSYGIYGILLAFVICGLSHIFAIEKMKDEYKLGKKIGASVKTGFKKSIFGILDFSALVFIACVMLYIFGSVTAKSFAFVVGLGLLVNLFTTLVLSKVFFNWYVNYNSKNAKKINFKREATIDEIE